eukprot:TRINITY_DN90971_c0_g1_i1.p1 TRINITY_DN90971_c0_g1~~TRINITY_DN90971_c0_g1_i1.p1  ORF type:complete len:356 (-),score=47.86 TRINITY_DN90971_c0_g1_i1:127-1137(-)
MAAQHPRLCQNRRPLAVIGGAGPEAGLDVTQKLLDANRALLGSRYESDRDAPEVILFQAPGMGGPRQPTDLIDDTGAPFLLVWDSTVKTIRQIERLGCELFCISCNTLHILEPRIQRFCAENAIKSKFISLVGETARKIVKQQQAAGSDDELTVGILGSFNTTDVAPGTGKSPYRVVFEEINTHCDDKNASAPPPKIRLLQLPDTDRHALQALLGRIKLEGVGPDEVTEPGKTCIAHNEKALLLADMLGKHKYDQTRNPGGAHVFVLACSEFPLLLPKLHASADAGKISKDLVCPTSLLDPARVVADVMIQRDLEKHFGEGLIELGPASKRLKAEV